MKQFCRQELIRIVYRTLNISGRKMQEKKSGGNINQNKFDITYMTSLRSLKYVGIYWEDRFKTESYWTSKQYPIRSLEELIRFVNSRRGYLMKERLKDWLSRVMRNRRANECVEGSEKLINGSLIRYRVRHENEKGWNAIVDFLREHVREEMRRKIPARKRGRRVSNFPLKCKKVI